jgi:hypothetical protein
MTSERDYLYTVSEDTALKRILKKLSLTEVRVFDIGSNTGIWISKPQWRFPDPPVRNATVWVHFEARRPGECRLEVDTHPYVPGLAQKPEQLAELKTAVEIKALLLRRLRECLMAEPEMADLGASVAALRDPEQPDAGTAVKFLGEFPGGAPPAETARFIAHVVERVAPVVDRCLADAMRDDG